MDVNAVSSAPGANKETVHVKAAIMASQLDLPVDGVGSLLEDPRTQQSLSGDGDGDATQVKDIYSQETVAGATEAQDKYTLDERTPGYTSHDEADLSKNEAASTTPTRSTPLSVRESVREDSLVGTQDGPLCPLLVPTEFHFVPFVRKGLGRHPCEPPAPAPPTMQVKWNHDYVRCVLQLDSVPRRLMSIGCCPWLFFAYWQAAMLS